MLRQENNSKWKGTGAAGSYTEKIILKCYKIDKK